MVQTFKQLSSQAKDLEKEAIDMLSELTRFKTVSPRNEDELKACADSITDAFKERGYTSAKYTEGGAPVVYASKDVGSKKTLLFYHHYDVQPEGSLDLWQSSPWELTERGGRLYGRGTSDDKGPLVSSIIGIELIEQILGKSPVNVRFVVEGEEEAGSISLPNFVRDNEEFINADGCIWEGGRGNTREPGRSRVRDEG